MPKQLRTAIVGQLHDYRKALTLFGDNAKSYLLSGFLQGLGAGMLAVVFAIYIKAAGMSEGVVGGVEAAVAFAAAVVCLVGAPLVAKVGYRGMLVGALALIIGARLGQAALPFTAAMVGCALAIGLGDGFMRAISSAFLSHNSKDEERTHLFSTDFVTRMMSGFVGGLAGGFLPTMLQHLHVSEVSSYQWTIVTGTLVMACGLLPMLRIKEPKEDAKSVRDAYVDSFRHFREWKQVGKLIAPQAFISLGGGLVIPFVPLYLKHWLHADIAQIGTIQALASVVLGFVTFGTPVIARKFGLVKGVAMMQLASVPFLALVPFAGTLWVAVAFLWTRNACMNMAGPMYNQFSMEGISAKDKPLVAGWMFFALNVMWMFGNLIGGRLMEINYTAPYPLAVACYATGAIGTYLMWRKSPAAAHGKQPQVETAAA